MARKRTATLDVQTIAVKPNFIKQEMGRRRNNKGKPAAERARAKTFWAPVLNKDIVTRLNAGETVRHTFGSGRVVDFVLAD